MVSRCTQTLAHFDSMLIGKIFQHQPEFVAIQYNRKSEDRYDAQSNFTAAQYSLYLKGRKQMLQKYYGINIDLWPLIFALYYSTFFPTLYTVKKGS
jgi:hypothetical protein